MCSWLVINYKFTPNYGVTVDSVDLDFKHMRHFGTGSINISVSICSVETLSGCSFHNIIHKTLRDWHLILWTYCLHSFQSLSLSFWHCFEQFYFSRRPPDALSWSSCGAKSDTLTAVWHFCQLRPKGALRVNSTQQEPHKWVNHARYGMSCRYESELTSPYEDTNIT